MKESSWGLEIVGAVDVLICSYFPKFSENLTTCSVQISSVSYVTVHQATVDPANRSVGSLEPGCSETTQRETDVVNFERMIH